MNRLNGWQRIGVLFSVLWCFVVAGVTAAAYYEYSQDRSQRAASQAAIDQCREGQPKGLSRKDIEKACGISFYEFAGPKPAERPSVLAFVALLSLPIAAGWLLVYIILWATRWVRAGFKAK
jgi:hypothetical protein